jgi:acetolactate synthase I/II/III large subunit
MSEKVAELTGAQALVSTLADCGVTACFANPGTSEMHLVTALDTEPRIRPVLCLFEGVATGAADGFARMADMPAMTLLHLGAGYLNGGANIHNAKRAYTPMINVIGDHAVPHLRYDAPLTSNIIGLAGPNSTWIKSADTVASTGKLAAEAWAASFGAPGGPVSLILPADSAWTAGGTKASVPKRPVPLAVSSETVARVAAALKAASKPVLLVNGSATRAEGLALLARLEAAGVRVLMDTFLARQTRGAGHFHPGRMMYFAEGAMADLAGTDLMVLAGTIPPAAFFAYPGKPSLLVPEGCTLDTLCGPEGDVIGGLSGLCEALSANASAPVAVRQVPDAPQGALTAASVGQSLARHMQEGAIVSDDGVTSSLPIYLQTAAANPHDWLMLTGGAIGQGLPAALGAAVAKPDAKVIALTGDGAGMYTLQALWTMAREKLDVTTLVFVNHSYRILNIELMRTGAGNPGPAAHNLLTLGGPELDWVSLAKGHGVAAEAVSTAADFDASLARAMAEKGPRLIAVMMAG